MPETLDPGQRARFRQLIEDAHLELAVELFGIDAVPRQMLDYAVEQGILTPEHVEGIRTGAIGDAYLFGHWLAEQHAERARDVEESGRPDGSIDIDDDVASASMTYPEFTKRAPALYAALSDWEKRMARAAREEGAQLVVGLGNEIGSKFETTLISSDNEEARLRRMAISEEVALSVEDRRSWRQLRSRLGHTLGGDWARNLSRIAVTQTVMAINDGQADAIRKMEGPEALVAIVPNASACPQCRAHYLEGGRPRIFRLAELPGPRANFRKKQAEWVPTRPPLHPWCTCQSVWVPAGWHFDESWALRPPKKPEGVDTPPDSDDVEKSMSAASVSPPRFYFSVPTGSVSAIPRGEHE